MTNRQFEVEDPKSRTFQEKVYLLFEPSKINNSKKKKERSYQEFKRRESLSHTLFRHSVVTEEQTGSPLECCAKRIFASSKSSRMTATFDFWPRLREELEL